MDTPVNFALAKLLKGKKQNIITKLMYASNGELTDAIYDFDDWCFAPTIAEVVMWLYDKHGVWISCHYNKSVTFSISIVDDCENSIGEGLFGERFKTPTEAYTEAIKYCLTNLIK